MPGDQRAKCPTGTVTGLAEVCYLFKSHPLSYRDAIATCVADGGNLLSIHDQRTNDFIAALIAGTGMEWFFLGADDAGGKWEWADGTPFNFSHWIDSTSTSVVCNSS